jgi:hypothetical protein
MRIKNCRVLFGLSLSIDTKAKCRHQKSLTCI